ncbi:hypothetical protein RRG08_016127, partial [Elysia crispata]
KVESRFIRPKC